MSAADVMLLYHAQKYLEVVRKRGEAGKEDDSHTEKNAFHLSRVPQHDSSWHI